MVEYSSQSARPIYSTIDLACRSSKMYVHIYIHMYIGRVHDVCEASGSLLTVPSDI